MFQRLISLKLISKQFKEYIVKSNDSLKTIECYNLKFNGEIVDDSDNLSDYIIETTSILTPEINLTTEIKKSIINIRFNSKIYTFELNNNTTIIQLKMKIEETIFSSNINIPYNLYLNNHILVNSSIINDYDVKSDDIIECITDLTCIFVKSFIGKTLCFYIRPNELIYNILKLIESKTNTPIEKIKIHKCIKGFYNVYLTLKNSDKTIYEVIGNDYVITDIKNGIFFTN